MLCEKCGKKMATTHLKTIINGISSEINLCSECASKFDDGCFLPNGLEGMLSSFFGDISSDERISTVTKCSCCGATFADIAKSGKMGCAECYKIFGERLMPSLQRIHGKTKHIGKTPYGGAGKNNYEITNEMKLDKLRNDLKKAIEEEKYEDAAAIRDEIKKMEGKE